MGRRRMLQMVGLGAVAAGAAACGTGTTTTTATADAATGLTEIPEETNGPYPGDGSNGPDVLEQSGVVRSDIRSGFGTSTTTAPGVPMTMQLTVLDIAEGGTPFTGAAVYVWHCDRDGNYSGRWPHVHFEVYPDQASITDHDSCIATSQIALPQNACDAVYAQPGYERSVSNLSDVTLASDNVFGDDGGAHQLGTVTGGVASGYAVALTVPVDTTTEPSAGGGGPGGGAPPN